MKFIVSKEIFDDIPSALFGVIIARGIDNHKSYDWIKDISRRPSGLRKTISSHNSLAHKTTWLRSDFYKI